MKSVRILLGMILLPIAALPPYLSYANPAEGQLLDPGNAIKRLGTACLAFGAALVFRVIVRHPLLRFGCGMTAGYSALLIALLVTTTLTGQLPETMKNLPLIIVFGAILMTPTVFLAWLSALFIYPNYKKNSAPPSIPKSPTPTDTPRVPRPVGTPPYLPRSSLLGIASPRISPVGTADSPTQKSTTTSVPAVTSTIFQSNAVSSFPHNRTVYTCASIPEIVTWPLPRNG